MANVIPPEKLASTVRAELDELVMDIGNQAENRAFRASNELQNALVYVLRGQRTGKIYRIPGTGRVKYDKKGHTASIIYKTYQASAPGEPPAVRTGAFRASWKRRNYADSQNNADRTIHSVTESDYKVGGKWILGEILENGTDDGRIKPRPYKERTKEMALPRIIKIYREPYRR